MHEEYVVKRHSKSYSFWIFTVQPIVFLTHPDTIKVVMKSNAPKAKSGAGYRFMIPWIGMFTTKIYMDLFVCLIGI